MLEAACFIRLHSINAVPFENVIRPRQKIQALQQTGGHQWKKGIEFQSAGGACHGESRVVSRHHHGGLGDRFGNDGVDLARHDRRTGLTGRQMQFAKSGFRP